MKINLKSLHTYAVRHALCVGIVVFFAALIDIYFSYSKEYWTLVVAFLVCQTTRGAPLRQGITSFLTITVTMLIVSLLQLITIPQIIFYFIFGVIFIFGEYFYTKRILINSNILIRIFLLIWIIAGLTPVHSYLIVQERVIDIMIGAGIGMLGQFIFSINIYEEFRHGIVPILQTLIDYSSLLSLYFLEQNTTQLTDLKIKKNAIQIDLQTQQGLYPEWVYESGFNPGLRSGYRFFLINVERMTELFFSLNYFVTQEVDAELLKTLSCELSLSIEKNQELLDFLLQYLKNGKIQDTSSDFTTDIANLEKTLQNHIPTSIELLDISRDYVLLVALVTGIKDLRELLLQLVSALPLMHAVK